jgi:Chromo (CHRromatin Organisation MOdifier) domain
MVEFAINNTPSEATGQSPFLLNYGINPRHPCIAQLVSPQQDITDLAVSNPAVFDVVAVTLRDVPDIPAATQFAEDMQSAIVHTKTMLQAARSRMQQQEKGKRTERVPFQVGDMVMLSTKYIKLLYKGCPKLMPRFVGPFPVTAVINPVAFRLELPHTFRIHNVFHSSLLKPFISRPGEEVHPPRIVVNDENEYEVELLVDRRIRKIRTVKAGKHSQKKQSFAYQYLVRWKGYGPEHDEWVPEKELARHCKALIRKYDTAHPRPIEQ